MSYEQYLQQALTGAVEPSQNGVNALAAAQRDLGASQEALDSVISSVAANTELQNTQELIKCANQKTAEALALLGRISGGMQIMADRIGIDVPVLTMPAPVSASPAVANTGNSTAPSSAEVANTISHEALATSSTGDFVRHALAFYGDILDTYSKEKAEGGKGAAKAAEEWLAANRLMCEFALDIQDLQLASQCYGYINDSATKWDMVAKAYHAGYPLLAEDWQAPLRLAIEHGENDPLTLVAAQKARASMALDRARLAEDEQSRTEQLREVDAAWQTVSKLLNDARGKTMAPSESKGLFESDRTEIAADQDVRTHMLEFVKLYCANGEFQRAREISGQINQITRESQAYYRNMSREADYAVKEFLPTIELREQCAGLTASEIAKRAKRWRLYQNDTVLAKVGELIHNPGMLSWRQDRTPGLDVACAFLEETYPEISFKGPQTVNEPHAKYDIMRSGWEDAADTYESNMHWSVGLKSQLIMLEDALQLARHEQEAMAKAELRQQESINNIRRIQSDWQNEFPHADTLAIPQLRQAKLDELKAYIGQTQTSVALQRGVFEALLEAQDHIAPKTNLVQESIIKYVDKKLKMLQSIPNYEQEYADQLAELAAIRQLAQ